MGVERRKLAGVTTKLTHLYTSCEWSYLGVAIRTGSGLVTTTPDGIKGTAIVANMYGVRGRVVPTGDAVVLRIVVEGEVAGPVGVVFGLLVAPP